jgi:hypothetical protein
MKVLIDGTTKRIALDKDARLSDALELVKQSIGKESRIIKSIAVDELEFGPDTADALLKKKTGTIKTLSVVTDTPMMLAVATLKKTDAYLENFRAHLEKFCRVLQTGGEEEDYETFIAGLKGWENVMQLLMIMRDMLHLDYASMKVKGKTPDVLTGELQKVLDEIKSALQKQDVVYLRDLLRYELIPNVDGMQELVKAIAVKAKKAVAS